MAAAFPRTHESKLNVPARSTLSLIVVLLLEFQTLSNSRAQQTFDSESMGVTVALGMTVDMATGQPLRTESCVEIITRSSEGGGGTGEMSVEEAQSAQSMRERLGFGASASMRFLGAGVSAKAKYIREMSFRSENSYHVVDVRWQNSMHSAQEVRLTKRAKALALQDKKTFKQVCGTGYVADIRTGGSFSAVVTTTKASAEEREAVQAALRATFPAGSVEGNVESSQTLSKLGGRVNYRAQVEGGYEDFPDLPRIKEYARALRHQLDPKINPRAQPKQMLYTVVSYEPLLPTGMESIFSGVRRQREVLEAVSVNLDTLSALEPCLLGTDQEDEFREAKDEQYRFGEACFADRSEGLGACTLSEIPKMRELKCPVPPPPPPIEDLRDGDKDGVYDADDACPEKAGPREWAGCPDDDKDGKPNNVDPCPEAKGSKGEECPTKCDRLAEEKDATYEVKTLTRPAGRDKEKHRVYGTNDLVHISIIGECGRTPDLGLFEPGKDDHEAGKRGRYIRTARHVGHVQALELVITHHEGNNPHLTAIDDWHYDYVKVFGPEGCFEIGPGKVASGKKSVVRVMVPASKSCTK